MRWSTKLPAATLQSPRTAPPRTVSHRICQANRTSNAAAMWGRRDGMPSIRASQRAAGGTGTGPDASSSWLPGTNCFSGARRQGCVDTSRMIVAPVLAKSGRIVARHVSSCFRVAASRRPPIGHLLWVQAQAQRQLLFPSGFYRVAAIQQLTRRQSSRDRYLLTARQAENQRGKSAVAAY